MLHTHCCSITKLRLAFNRKYTYLVTISINVQSIHNFMDITIIWSVRSLPHWIPKVFQNLFVACLVINNYAPLSKVTNIKILGSSIRTLIIYHEEFRVVSNVLIIIVG